MLKHGQPPLQARAHTHPPLPRASTAAVTVINPVFGLWKVWDDCISHMAVLVMMMMTMMTALVMMMMTMTTMMMMMMMMMMMTMMMT